jgi:flagellar hook assembly protein FlgD
MLIHETKEPGTFSVRWNGTDESGAQVASGVYFVRLEAGARSVLQRMVLLR